MESKKIWTVVKIIGHLCLFALSVWGIIYACVKGFGGFVGFDIKFLGYKVREMLMLPAHLAVACSACLKIISFFKNGANGDGVPTDKRATIGGCISVGVFAVASFAWAFSGEMFFATLAYCARGGFALFYFLSGSASLKLHIAERFRGVVFAVLLAVFLIALSMLADRGTLFLKTVHISASGINQPAPIAFIYYLVSAIVSVACFPLLCGVVRKDK